MQKTIRPGSGSLVLICIKTETTGSPVDGKSEMLCSGRRGDALHRRAVGRDQLDHLRPPTPASANLLRGSRTHDLSQVTSLCN